MDKMEIRKAILRVCRRIGDGIDPYIVEALVWQESSYLPDASRFELRFYERYCRRISRERLKELNPWVGSAPTYLTERIQLAHSFGLMQILGLRARELGFRGRYLTSLCFPEIGLRWGVEALLQVQKRYREENLEKVISAYNAGRPTDRNRKYVEQVLEKIDRLRRGED